MLNSSFCSTKWIGAQPLPLANCQESLMEGGGGGLPYDGVAYSFLLHAKESAVSCGWVGHLAPVQT